MKVSRSDFHVMAAGLIIMGLILVATMMGIRNDSFVTPSILLVSGIVSGICIGTGMTFFLFMHIQRKARQEQFDLNQPQSG
jgi:hypothetical protein